MIARGGLFLLIVALVVAGVWAVRRPGPKAEPGRAPWRPPITHPKNLEERIPAEMQQLIRSAGRVEGILVHSQIGNGNPEDSTIGEYAIRSTPVELDQAQARALKRLLLDRQSFQNEGYACEFSPNVVYRFVAAGDTVDVVICHGCDDVILHSGVLQGSGNVNPVGRSFEAISHEIFPADSVISAIWRKGLGSAADSKGDEK